MHRSNRNQKRPIAYRQRLHFLHVLHTFVLEAINCTYRTSDVLVLVSCRMSHVLFLVFYGYQFALPSLSLSPKLATEGRLLLYITVEENVVRWVGRAGSIIIPLLALACDIEGLTPKAFKLDIFIFSTLVQ